MGWLLRSSRHDADRSYIGNSHNLNNNARVMHSVRGRKILAVGICVLFLMISASTVISDSSEKIISLDEVVRKSNTNSNDLNLNGTESGSIFSNSALEIGTDGPSLVLSNGTIVKWTNGNPVYIEGDVMSTSNRCNILKNYSLYCSGSNNYGQLGLGSTSLTEGYVSLNSAPLVVSSGSHHTCAILNDASLWCWGRNNLGQLGDGTFTNQISPVEISLGTGVIAVSTGEGHTCAITQTGVAMCWGSNIRGQLGDGTTTDSGIPVVANHSTGQRIVSIVTSSLSTCVIIQNGSLGCWGSKYTVFSDLGPIQSNIFMIDLGDGVTAEMIDSSETHICAVVNDGSMQCWGLNTHGQLGNGTCSSTLNENCSTENSFPGEGDSNSIVNITNGLTVISAAAGPHSTCAIISDHSLRCWGEQSSSEFDGIGNDLLNPFVMNANTTQILFTDQDIDGDGIRNIFESNQTGDSDGDGFLDTEDDFSTNPALWIECPSGQYGRITCQDVDSGYYSDSGSLIQIACSPGSFQPNSGQSECLDASAGYFVENHTSTSQTQCPSGHYNSLLGQSSCTEASAGSYVSPNGDDAGDTSSSSVSLSLMSANYTGNLDGSSDTVDIFSLTTSRPTYFSANLSSPQGYDFNLLLLNSSFNIIESSTLNGTFDEISSIGSSNASGTYFIQVVWSAGNNSLQNYNLIVNIRNVDGDQSQIGTTETQVMVEKYLASNLCQPGTWQQYSGQTSCDQADPGYFTSQTGATSQTPCSPGFYQPSSGSNSCIIASIGYYVSYSGALVQTAAPPGSYVGTNGASSATLCSPGTYQSQSGQSNCFATNSGYYAPIPGSTSQTACSPGFYQNQSGQSFCLPASSGYYVQNSTSTTQAECLAGTYQPNAGQSSCILATPGYYVPTNTSTEQYPCLPGSYQPNSGQISCILTSPGYYTSNNSSASQIPCPLGYYQPLQGQESCLIADPGFYVDSNGSILQLPCPMGSYNPFIGAQSSNDCTLADPGFHVPLQGSISQVQCLAGTYSSSFGQIICDAAEPGYFVPSNGATQQTACTPGFWQDEIGQTSCKIAMPGHYSDSIASDIQIQCLSGTYNPNSGSNSSSACVSADPGHYAPSNGAIQQFSCSEGNYQPAPGQSSCMEADLGYHVPSIGATGQIGCTMGSYSPIIGGSECIIASPGYYVDSHFASEQNACSPGTYNPEEGSTEAVDCLDADAGYFVSSIGSSTQEECEIGYFQPNKGALNCLIADPGHFVDEYGAISQIACELGTYNSESGSITSSACLQSDPGNYVPQSASTGQIPCDPGTYQNLRGQAVCITAGIGFYVPESGSSSQTPSPLDYYVDYNGSLEPTPCPQGQITMSLGSDEISDCNLDTDGDRFPDFLDKDDDNDGVDDGTDLCDPGVMNWTSAPAIDFDGDGCLDEIEDDDDDNDGYLDVNDAFPLDPYEWLDTDGDGIGNNADLDDDGDGVLDLDEIELGLDPLIADFDGDGYNDSIDAFPDDPDEWLDSDGDGVGDNSDKFPTLKFYQSYDQVLIHVVIGIFVLAVIGFSVKMGIGRKEKLVDVDDSTHEVREIADVTIPIDSSDVEEHVDESFDSQESANFEEATSSEDESRNDSESLEIDDLLLTIPPPKPRIEPPSDAQTNDHGQKVWRDEEGTVWVQNPDGSLLKHNVLTGTWDSYDQ